MPEFLVELYVARSDDGTISDCTERARAAAEELSRGGMRIRCVSSILVPDDETWFLLYEADSVNDVHDAAARAGLAFERVTLAHARAVNH